MINPSGYKMSLRFFVLCAKKFQATHTWNFLICPNFWLRIPLWFFFLQNFVCSLSQHFWDTQHKKISEFIQADTPSIRNILFTKRKGLHKKKFFRTPYKGQTVLAVCSTSICLPLPCSRVSAWRVSSRFYHQVSLPRSHF